MDNPTVKKLSLRARWQLTLAVIFFALTVLALVVPMWIEEVTGLSPDGGSGETELLLAVPFGLASIVLGVLTYRTRRKIAATRA
jgi:hypothetical protein